MPGSIRRRWSKTLIPLALLLLLAAVGIGITRANPSDVPTPEEITTQVAGEPANETVVPPGSSPPWLLTDVSFPGRTIHWTSAGWFRQPGIRDPANGETVYGEFWVEFDDDGAVLHERERFTLADGSFFQESTSADGVNTMVLSPEFGMSPCPEANCFLSRAESSPPPASSLIPRFIVSADTLVSLGFAPVPNESAEFLETSPLPGVAPEQVFAAAGPAETWEQRTTSGDETSTIRMGLATNGRLLLRSDAQTTDSAGTIIDERHSVFGTLYVYASENVPSSVFTLVTASEEPCK